MTAAQRAALVYLDAHHDPRSGAAPSAIGEAIAEAGGGSRKWSRQALGRTGGRVASNLIKMGFAAIGSRDGFPGYVITAAGRVALQEAPKP